MEAEWKYENYPHGAHVSAAIIQDALPSYANIGNSKKVEELKILLKERTGIEVKQDMKKIMVGVESPKEAIDALLNTLQECHDILTVSGLGDENGEGLRRELRKVISFLQQ